MVAKSDLPRPEVIQGFLSLDHDKDLDRKTTSPEIQTMVTSIWDPQSTDENKILQS